MDGVARHLVADSSELEHPEGWNALVEGLSSALEKISPDYSLYQTKQKFGQLRFYASYVTPDNTSVEEMKKGMDAFNSLINIAEDRSLHICEVCGQEGARGNFGNKAPFNNYRTLCVAHQETING